MHLKCYCSTFKLQSNGNALFIESEHTPTANIQDKKYTETHKPASRLNHLLCPLQADSPSWLPLTPPPRHTDTNTYLHTYIRICVCVDIYI